MRLLISICALAASAVPAVALDDPNRLVKSLYQLPDVPMQHQDIDRFFSRDLAAAIKRDLTGARPGGYNAADWRFQGEDEEVADLMYWRDRTRTVPRVTVELTNTGEISVVTYELCLGSQGWRIANVRNRSGDMRRALDVPSAPVSC